VQIEGVYVLDMIAHNNDHDPDVFQISPGAGRESLRLAYHAHVANAIWNASVPAWNGRAPDAGAGRGQRSKDGKSLPATAMHPPLHGEVRPAARSRSSLYNTGRPDLLRRPACPAVAAVMEPKRTGHQNRGRLSRHA